MTNCYCCQIPLTSENSSKEHVIPNSIGGHLKSKNLLCKSCNQKTSKPEAGFARKLNHYTCLLRVKRDRGTGHGIEVKTPMFPGNMIIGPDLNVRSKGPAYEFKMDPDGKRFNLRVAADNKEQLPYLIEKILKEHPEIDRNSKRALKRKANKSKVKERTLNQFSYTPVFFDRDELRIVCKSAVSFYLLKKDKRHDVEHLFDFIFAGGPNKCVLFSNPNEIEIMRLEPERSYHSIVLRGDEETKTLLAYVEYYELYKFHILLSANYRGEDFIEKYIYDIFSRKEVEKEVLFNVSANEIKSGFKHMKHGNLCPIAFEKLWWLMKWRDDEKVKSVK